MLGWMPNLPEGRPLRVLCLGAHCDDIEIGCGGTLMKFAQEFQPLEVRWVVFSGAGARVDEARASAAHWLQDVAQKQVDLHGFRDGFFPDKWAQIKEVFEELASFSPDLIFTHQRADLHQDHRIIHELTWNTFRDHAVLEYEIPKYDGDLGAPNFLVPITADTARKKAQALMQFFESQTTKHWFCEELFLGLMRLRGMEINAPSGYAEGFYARKICA